MVVPSAPHALRVLLLAAAMVLLSGCAADSGAAGGGGATVEVDVFSGRENPRVPLCADAEEQLRELLHEEAADAEEPELGLGFRGFVVTTDVDGESPVRLTPDAVYLERDGDSVVIVDGAGALFDAVGECVRAELDPELAEEIERSIE